MLFIFCLSSEGDETLFEETKMAIENEHFSYFCYI